MCLSAIDAATDKVVLAFRLKRTDKMREFRCKECKQPLTLRHGWIVTPHFAHLPESTCALRISGETQNHRDGKLLVIDELIRMNRGVEPILIETEYRDPLVPRRADVAFFTEDDRQIHEIQLSSNIPYETMDQRTRDWENHGYTVAWHFGKACLDAQPILEWIKDRGQTGFYLNFPRQVDIADIPPETGGARLVPA